MQKFLNLEEAATLYGCQVNKIQDFINQSKLSPIYKEEGFFLIRKEIEKLKQKHLGKRMVNAKLSKGKL